MCITDDQMKGMKGKSGMKSEAGKYSFYADYVRI